MIHRTSALTVLLALWAGAAAPVAAQDLLRDEDGRAVIVTPEPDFLPPECVAVVQISGWSKLASKMSTVVAPLAGVGAMSDAIGSIERILLSQRGLPGIHPTRPFFFGFYDPTLVDFSMTPPKNWQDILCATGFGVAAIPVIDAGLFHGTLGTRLAFVRRENDGTLIYHRRSTDVDFEAWVAAMRQGKAADTMDRMPGREFAHEVMSEVYAIPAADYVLLTTNRMIAEVCRQTNAPARWRRLADADVGPEIELKTGPIVERGRFLSAADDVVISLDVETLYQTHSRALDGAIARLKRTVGDNAVLETSAALGGILDTYADFMATVLRSIKTLELSLSEFQGGVVASFRVACVPGTPLADWFEGGQRAPRPALLHLLPSGYAFSCSIDTNLDENALRMYHDLMHRVILAARPSTKRADVDAWLAEASDTVRSFTGRMAVGLNAFGTDGFSMVQVSELKTTTVERPSTSIGPESILARIAGEGVAVRITPAPKRTIAAVTVDVSIIEFDLTNSGARVTHPGGENAGGDSVIKLEMLTGVYDRFSILSIGQHAESAFAGVIARLTAPAADDADRRRNAALRSFENTGFMRGIVDVMAQVVVSAGAATPAGRATEAGLLRRFKELQQDARVGFQGNYADGIASFSFFVAPELLRAVVSAEEVFDDLTRLQVSDQRLRFVAQALGQFHRRHKRYPSAEEGLGTLMRKDGADDVLIPPYLAHFITDGWGNPLRYESLADGSVRIASLGRDAEIGGEGASADLTLTIP